MILNDIGHEYTFDKIFYRLLDLRLCIHLYIVYVHVFHMRICMFIYT